MAKIKADVVAATHNTANVTDTRISFKTIVAAQGLLQVAKEAHAKGAAQLAHIDNIFSNLYTLLRDALASEDDNEPDIPIDGGLFDLRRFISAFSDALEVDLQNALAEIPPSSEIAHHFYANALYSLCKPIPEQNTLKTQRNDAPISRDSLLDDSIRRFHANGDVGASISALTMRMAHRPEAAVIDDLRILMEDFQATVAELPRLFPEVHFPEQLLVAPIVFHSSAFVPLLASGQHMALAPLQDLRDALGSTLIHPLAADPTSTKSEIKRALAAGQNPNEADALRQLPIHLCCAQPSDHDTVRTFLRAGADPSAVTHFGSAPLHYACASGNLPAVRQLFDPQFSAEELDANTKDVLHRTPLHYAAIGGYVEIVKYLIAMPKVDINAPTVNGSTPLMWAIESGKVDVALLLLEDTRLDVSTADEDGRTAVHLAVMHSQARVLVKVLELPSADPNAKANDEMTPLMMASGAELGILLRQPRIDAGAIDKAGMTALHHAATRNEFDDIHALANRRDCNPFSHCKAGRLAVDYASGECKDLLQGIMTRTKKELLALGKDMINIPSLFPS